MKGQASGLDILIAIMLFSSAYSVLNSIYADMPLQRSEFDFLSVHANIATEQLLSQPGRPIDWTSANVSQLGLTITRGVIEKDKLGNFLNLSANNLNKTLELLGASGSKFYFNITYINGTTLFINSTSYSGNAVAGSDFNSTPMAVHRAIAIYNGSRVFVTLKLGS